MVTRSDYSGYTKDKEWSDLLIQPIAIKKVYNVLWPSRQVIELDKAAPGTLRNILDIAGADKLLRHSDGAVSLLAQRFRRADKERYDDFTLRYNRINGNKTEWEKVIDAVREGTGGLVAGYYAVGLVNSMEDGFTRFRVVDFPRFLQGYLSGKLPKPGYQKNKDDGTSFLYWPFSQLGEYLVYQLGDFCPTRRYCKYSSPRSKWDKIRNLMLLIGCAEADGQCAVCRKRPMEIYPSGSRSMACGSQECKRAWLLPGRNEVLDESLEE